MTPLEKIACLANDVLSDRERVTTPAEARLALALHEYGRGYQIIGREGCKCGENAECDECPPLAGILASLTALAASDQPVPPFAHGKDRSLHAGTSA